MHRQHAILTGSIAVLAEGPYVVAAAGHLHHVAEEGDGIGIALDVNEHQARGPSLAKNLKSNTHRSHTALSNLATEDRPMAVGHVQAST